MARLRRSSIRDFTAHIRTDIANRYVQVMGKREEEILLSNINKTITLVIHMSCSIRVKVLTTCYSDRRLASRLLAPLKCPCSKLLP